MVKSISGIKAVINRNRDFLRNGYGVRNIGIFGSVARRENTVASDVDILVEFSQPVGFFKFLELEEFLSKLVGRKVDLVTKNALKPIIKEDVLKEAVYV